MSVYMPKTMVTTSFRTRIYILVFAFTFLSSCIAFKKVPYFQDIPQTGESEEPIKNFSPVLIQPFDVLTITVTSLNPEASALFNMPVSQHVIPANVTTTINSTLNNNQVNNNNNNT